MKTGNNIVETLPTTLYWPAEKSKRRRETVEVESYGGQIKKLWVFSRTALWYTPRWPPVAIRFVIVCDPEGKLRMEAFF